MFPPGSPLNQRPSAPSSPNVPVLLQSITWSPTCARLSKNRNCHKAEEIGQLTIQASPQKSVCTTYRTAGARTGKQTFFKRPSGNRHSHHCLHTSRRNLQFVCSHANEPFAAPSLEPASYRAWCTLPSNNTWYQEQERQRQSHEHVPPPVPLIDQVSKAKIQRYLVPQLKP